MSINDRRIVNRKPWVMPIRFVVLKEEFAMSGSVQANSPLAAGRESVREQSPLPHLGETLNLSERGVAFKSSQPVSLGQPIELFFTLPTELIGRMPEDVRCTARVVHVDHLGDVQGPFASAQPSSASNELAPYDPGATSSLRRFGFYFVGTVKIIFAAAVFS